MTDPGSYQQAMMIATILNNRDQYRNLDYKDTKTWKAHVPEWLHEYRNVFNISQRECHYRNHMTMLLTLWKAQSFPSQQRSIAKRNSFDTWIDEELKKGYIHSSTSLIAAPFFFVKKHDGSLWPVMDYRALNTITVKNHYPICKGTSRVVLSKFWGSVLLVA